MQAVSIGCYPVTWHLVDNAPALAWITSPTYGATGIESADYCTVVLPQCDYRAELLNAPLSEALEIAEWYELQEWCNAYDIATNPACGA
jgi:hypothetical protein